MNEKIYSVLKHRILFLEYRPGQILNEKVLAQEFGVSRTPLREVLNRLEWEQLARILPRSGTMVTEIEFQKMMNVYQVRLEIEELAGKLAADHLTADHIEWIEALESECDKLLTVKNRALLAGIDFKLREMVYEAAGNPVLTEISERLYHQTFRLWASIMEKGEWSEEVRAMSDEISELLTAFKSSTPHAAGNIRKDHMMKHLERLRSKFLGIKP
jgi:DNA-binding GntR family transcriptional regulator